MARIVCLAGFALLLLAGAAWAAEPAAPVSNPELAALFAPAAAAPEVAPDPVADLFPDLLPPAPQSKVCVAHANGCSCVGSCSGGTSCICNASACCSACCAAYRGQCC